MSYTPSFHRRRSIRLKGYDYSHAGMYFVTICCHDMLFRFGKISDKKMVLNDFGKIAFDEWHKLPERYPRVILDVFQIMPNHIHGIIVLENVGAGLAPALNEHDVIVGATLVVAQNPMPVSNNTKSRAGASLAPTIAAIVGVYDDG